MIFLSRLKPLWIINIYNYIWHLSVAASRIVETLCLATIHYKTNFMWKTFASPFPSRYTLGNSEMWRIITRNVVSAYYTSKYSHESTMGFRAVHVHTRGKKSTEEWHQDDERHRVEKKTRERFQEFEVDRVFLPHEQHVPSRFTIVTSILVTRTQMDVSCYGCTTEKKNYREIISFCFSIRWWRHEKNIPHRIAFASNLCIDYVPQSLMRFSQFKMWKIAIVGRISTIIWFADSMCAYDQWLLLHAHALPHTKTHWRITNIRFSFAFISMSSFGSKQD